MGHTAIRFVAKLGLATAMMATFATSAEASSNDNECGIWLCLPVGFGVQGCSEPKKAFLKRIRKGRSPLPSLGRCSGGKSEGRYDMVYDPFQSCPAGWAARHTYPQDDNGYVYRNARYGHRDVTRGATSRTCVDPASCYTRDDRRGGLYDESETFDDFGTEMVCTRQQSAPRNSTPYHIDMIIDGERLPRYSYSLNAR